MPESWFASARREFHASLLTGTLTRSDGAIPSNADKGSVVSVAIANAILDQIGTSITGPKLPGQTAGANFEDICASEYSNGATLGNRTEVWDSFDKPQKVKAVPAANEDAGEGEGDTFAGTGISAE